MKARLHQIEGCTLLPNRYYIFDAATGAQIVDQLSRGFPTVRSARAWLSHTAPDAERKFTIARGRDARPV